MKTGNLQLAVIAVVLAGAMSASAQVSLTFNGVSPSEIVTLQVGSPINIGPEGVYAGIYNQTIDGVATPSFCIDVSRDITLNETLTDYSYTNLSLAPLAPAGPMGSTVATDIEKLWAAYYPDATTDMSGQTAAALQVAIWEDIAPYVGYSLSVTGNDPVTTQATAMLTNLPNLSDEANLEGLVSPTGQNYVVLVSNVEPVPEPTSLALASLGGLGVLLLRRKR
jgi:hypothetical protein